MCSAGSVSLGMLHIVRLSCENEIEKDRGRINLLCRWDQDRIGLVPFSMPCLLNLFACLQLGTASSEIGHLSRRPWNREDITLILGIAVTRLACRDGRQGERREGTGDQKT